MDEDLAAQLEVARATSSERLILRHLMQLYNYDFTEFDDADVDEFGLYRYDYIDHYWTDADRHAYLVRVTGKLAGFALIRIETLENGARRTNMSEFFIMRKYRGQGVGAAVARHLFDRYPGPWEVAELVSNLPAQAFWRKVIGRYTEGQFEDAAYEDGIVAQTFVSRAVSHNIG